MRRRIVVLCASGVFDVLDAFFFPGAGVAGLAEAVVFLAERRGAAFLVDRR